MDFGIPHGYAAALTLSPVMDINETAVPEIIKIKKIFGGIEGFNAWMADVTRGIQELRLSAFGVGNDKIDGIVKSAFTFGRMDNNPIPIKEETVKTILENII
jgi:alcohol dehydrogenase class IV